MRVPSEPAHICVDGRRMVGADAGLFYKLASARGALARRPVTRTIRPSPAVMQRTVDCRVTADAACGAA